MSDIDTVGYSVARVLHFFLIEDDRLADVMHELPRFAHVQYFVTHALH